MPESTISNSIKVNKIRRSSRKGGRSLSVFLSTAAVLCSTAAAGQERQSRDAGAGAGAGTDIVVTARRRDESVTEVPASITAYSSEFLEKQNIQSFVDYATKVPNLSFQYGQGNNNLWSGDRETAIRGVVGNGTTAYYIDDTPVPSSVTPQVLNLERVEVLKGPQGTLFGASSMGGNMRFITKKPSLTDSSGEAEIQAGGTKNAGLDLMTNMKGGFVIVPDRIAIDAAAGYMHESGFLTRRFPGENPDNPISVKDQARSDIFSGSLALRVAVTDSLEATISALGQYTNLQGFPGAYVPLPSYTPVSYTVDRDSNVQEYSKDRWGLGAFVLKYNGEGFSITSSSSFFKRHITEVEDDTEGTNTYFENVENVDLGRPTFYYLTHDKEERYTQETRLSFDEGTIIPKLSGIVGAFYQRQISKNDAPPIVVPELEAAGFPYPYVTNTKSINKNTNFAIFGEIYYEVIPKLTVTLGLRQYMIKQTQDPAITTGSVFGPTGIAEEPGFREKQSGLVPKAVISYAIGNRGNIYASAAKGFRPGGSGGQMANYCAPDLAKLGLDLVSASRYRSDSLWSYEVGAKSQFAGGRLSASAAAFRMDWSDIQQTTLLAECGLPLTMNAGKARIKGGEVEVSGQPFADVPLTLQFGVGYTDARLIDPGILEQDPNSRLGSVPKWTGTVSGYYEAPIQDDISLFLSADYSYTSSTKVLTVTDTEGNYVTRRPINLVNANFGVNVGPAQIMFFVKNLFDKRLNLGHQSSRAFEREEMLEDGTTQMRPRGVVSRPRQMGVQLHLNF